jgi:integrase
MGRTRTRDKHLPQRLYLERGTYWFRPKGAKPVNCGHDLTDAIAKYAALIGTDWSGRTIGDVIDRYRAEVLPLKRSAATRKDQATQLDRLKKYCGHILPDAFTAQHAYRYLDGRRTKDGEPAPVAARHEVALLGHVLGKAIRWGVSTVNAVRDIDYGPRSPRRPNVPLEEVWKLHALATPRMKLAIEYALCAGQRREDLLKSKHDDCNDEGIVFEQGKTGAGVLVEWSPTLRELVRRSKAMSPQIPCEYILRTRLGRRYSPRGFSAMWQRLMKKHTDAGGMHFTFHDLRSVSATSAATLEEARDRLGHASSDTTKRHYVRGLTRAKARS